MVHVGAIVHQHYNGSAETVPEMDGTGPGTAQQPRRTANEKFRCRLDGAKGGAEAR